MHIQAMSDEECLDALARLRFGRLGCTYFSQPYIVPIYFSYHEGHLYAFSTPGQKIKWMRANPRVCVEADEIISPARWLSVIALGKYEELPDTPKYKLERNLASNMLGQRARWWKPASAASPHRRNSDSEAPIFYRIHIDQVTGRHATPDHG
jgi:nitroimidazol reductase NimA-like FMN-containing flavoprotein (pyridoxamine 5'-phosphate oxidase superfamily)